MDRRAARLVPVAGATWGSAIASTLLPAIAPALAAGWGVSAIVCAVAAAVCARSGARLVWVLATLVCVLSAVPAVVVAASEPARSAALSAGDGHHVRADVQVTGKAERTALGRRADAVVIAASAGASAVPAGVPVTVLLVDEVDGVVPGAVMRVSGGAFAADAGERAVLVLRADEAEVVSGPDGIAAASAWLRERLGASVTGLPEPGAGLVPGLAVGDTGGVSPELEDRMRAASLTHLTAVSGANCAIVVGLGFLLAARCGLGRGARVAVGLGALVGFVVLVTPEPSVVRAATMSAIAMLALLLGRRGAGLAVLAVAVTVLLGVDPWLGLSLGFALSVVATAALLVLARPLAAGLGRCMPRPLALALAVPLSAQLACGPLIVLVSPGVALYAVPANLLAAPAAPVATVIGLAACLAAPIPVLQAGLTAIAWLPAAWIAGIAGAVAALPAHTVPWAEGATGLVALAVAGAVVVVLILPGAPTRGSRLTRWLAASVAAGGAAVVAGSLLVASYVVPWSTPSTWTIAMCDVGQGDAVLVRSAGAVMLVDTGPDPEALGACLTRLGVRRIDVLVVTHFDADHVGGLAAVPSPVSLLLHGPLDEGGARDLAQVEAAQRFAAIAGARGALGSAAWRVLWPASGEVPPGNDASVVIEIAGGGVPRTLLLGDLGATAQQMLRAGGAAHGAYDVVKVSHHGSADQDAGLNTMVSAQVGLIGVGEGNDYGHPRAEIIDLLRAQGTTIARTDTDGLILVGTEGDRLTLWRERTDAASEALGRLEGWRPDDPQRPVAPFPSSRGGLRSLRRSS